MKSSVLQPPHHLERIPDEVYEWVTVEPHPQYSAIYDAVAEANPHLGKAQIPGFVTAVESMVGINLIIESDSDEPYSAERLEMTEIRWLQVLGHLGVADYEQRARLEDLQVKYRAISENIGRRAHLQPEDAYLYLEEILESGLIQTVSEAAEILINGPIVSGFGESHHAAVPDTFVRDFLHRTFRSEALRAIRLAKVERSPRFLLVVPTRDQRLDLLDLAQYNSWDVEFYAGDRFVSAGDRNLYERIARMLEQKTRTKDLEHKYKVRALSGVSSSWDATTYFSVETEDPRDYDYLDDLRALGLNEEDLLKLFMLSAIGHEVCHRYEESQFQQQVIIKYQWLMFVEHNILGREFVSDYVERHKKLYGSDKFLLMREDMAEAARIYVINAEFLKRHYPRRYEFIRTYLPFMRENGLRDIWMEWRQNGWV